MSTVNLSSKSPIRERFTIGVLCCINLLNFMDRIAVAGVLPEIQDYYEIDDDVAGFINTAFTIGYTLASPLFGYLGDRYSRKIVIAISLTIWSFMGIGHTIVYHFPLFMILRMLVGVGEAGFTVIAPSMLADLVTLNSRSIVFALFYFGVPVGTGIGLMISAKINQLLHGRWWWSLRVSPCLNTIFLIMFLFGSDPRHGEKDAEALGGNPAKATAYSEDLKYLFRNKSYVLIVAGYTFVCFVNAGNSWWAPKLYGFAIMLIEGEHGTEAEVIVARIGFLAIFTGVIGVSIGSGLSKILRPKYAFIDPVICGVGLLFATPFNILCIAIAPINMAVTFFFMAIGQLAKNTNWAVVMDMMMYVVVPTRRASAKAIESFFSHILGNSISTVLIGIISEAIQHTNSFHHWHNLKVYNTTEIDYGEVAQNFYGLQFALYSIMILLPIAGIIFLLTAKFIVADKEKAEEKAIEK